MDIREKILSEIVANHQHAERHGTECKRKLVGAAMLLVSPKGTILPLAHAVNRPAEGMSCTNEIGNCGCIHAEAILLTKLMRSPTAKLCDGRKGLLLCMYSPCTNCANLIVLSNLAGTVVYEDFTKHDARGVHVLEAAGVRVVALEEVKENGFHL